MYTKSPNVNGFNYILGFCLPQKCFIVIQVGKNAQIA